MSQLNRLSQALFRSPILWGALACSGFYALLKLPLLQDELIERYFAKHPVEYVATAMFFIGMAALAIKLAELAVQYAGLEAALLEPIGPGGQPVADCERLLSQLARLPAGRQQGYLVRRLRDALEHVRRTGSADAIDERLNHLADLDAARAHASYGLVRMFIWAIPILGFLGTVIGIAQAMGNLAPQALEDSLPQVMAGLTVAFDTTTLALGLCVVLFFSQFLTDRAESALLDRVDQRVEAELVGRFETPPEGLDREWDGLRRMTERLTQSADELVRRQAEIWRASIDAAGERWSTLADSAGHTLKTALAAALDENLRRHAQELAAAERTAAESNRRHWQQMQRALIENTEAVAGLQQIVFEKATVLARAVDATDQVTKLQAALNQNLRSLAGAKNFEQTVISLAAAIHLLNARLRELPGEVDAIELESVDNEQAGQAA